MKKPYYAILLMLVFCSCVAPVQYHQRINYIPTKGPNFGVEVLAQNQIPQKPYFEVIDFDFSAKGNLSKLEAKQRLEIEAIKEGLDAVIMLDYWKGYEEKENVLTFLIDVLDEDEETTVMNLPYTYIRGIGLKYLDNIDYLSDQPEFEYVYKISQETDIPSPYFKIEYNPTGQEHKVYPENEEAQEVYNRYFQFYSDFHLIYQRERWYHVNKNNKLKKRILINDNGRVLKTCLFSYDELDRMSKIVVSRKGIGDATITYHYDNQGRKLSKSLVSDGGLRMYEQYAYVGGKLDGRRIRIIDKTNGTYLLNTSILYYDADFLKDYYNEEHAKDEDASTSK